MKVKAIIGHIDFIDHIEPNCNHAVVSKIGKEVMVNSEKADEECELLMDREFQSYIIPELYKGTIKYSLHN